ncbi:NmrA family NAD(P)-binding protein [Psychromicrobium sp. YIM B11713]|uniref:NmrA family NAD(P)-binding protein n=1 Tax=Psychromicrobium sp. YIM B11713 TaxID=3145233 RepID=UPI00374F55D7
MTTKNLTLVVGATGNTGSRVTADLAALGLPVRAASRKGTALAGTEAVQFDWYNTETHTAALKGVKRLYLVPPVGDNDPAAVMLPFLAQAQEAGVQRAVLLSASAVEPGGPAVGLVHQALPEIFEEWAVLRPSWFMQNFIEAHPHALSIREEGTIWSATDDGRVGFIDAADIAAVAVRALLDEPSLNTDLILTGPETLSYDDVASIVAAAIGHPVIHRRLSYQQMRDRIAASLPLEFASLLAGMDRSIAEGSEDRITDTVQRITGRAPRSLRALLQHRAS